MRFRTKSHAQIPKDPSSIPPGHLDKAKRMVDDMIIELDGLPGGKILKGWAF